MRELKRIDPGDINGGENWKQMMEIRGSRRRMEKGNIWLKKGQCKKEGKGGIFTLAKNYYSNSERIIDEWI